MPMPTEWRGSDLRTRTEVVQYLTDHGGEVVDEHGFVVTKLREDMAKGRAITQLLADMENDGMIEREIRGRRTYRIVLRDDWGLSQRRHLRAAPEPAPANDGALINDNVDLDLLAESLLAIVVKRASQPQAAAPADNAASRALAARLRSAEADGAKLSKQLREANEERTAARERVSELETQVAALENNLALMQRELTRKPKGRGAESGVSLIDRLDDEGRATLRTLMQQLPETPESRPRKAQAQTRKSR